MGFLIVTAVLALSLWAVIGTFRRLRSKHVGRNWWLLFAALAFVGVAAGSWMALRFEYQASPSVRFFSFPVPLAFFRLENGRWVDYVTPPHVLYPGVVSNIVAVVGALLLPLLLASAIFHRRSKASIVRASKWSNS